MTKTAGMWSGVSGAALVVAAFLAFSPSGEITQTITGTDGQIGYQFNVEAEDRDILMRKLAPNVPCDFDVMSIKEEAGTFTGLVRCQ